MQKAFDELKEQYNILAAKDLQDMRRQPSNLVSSYSLHRSQQALPGISEQELIRENDFLKTRIASQDKRLANQDLQKMQLQNRLMKKKIEELESFVEDLTNANNEQLQNISQKQNIFANLVSNQDLINK